MQNTDSKRENRYIKKERERKGELQKEKDIFFRKRERGQKEREYIYYILKFLLIIVLIDTYYELSFLGFHAIDIVIVQ